MEYCLVCELCGTNNRSFVGYLDSRGGYKSSNFVNLGVREIMTEYDIFLINFIESSPVSYRAEM